MLVVDRTHPLERDLDWAPEQIRRWSPWRRDHYPIDATASSPSDDDGPGWLTLIPVVDAVLLPLWLITKAAGLVSTLGDGGSVDRSATYDDPRERNRLGDLQPRPVELAQLGEAAGGELLQVQGRITADETLTGVIEKTRGVARRLAYRATSGWWIHEALVAFAIEDGDGHRVPVQVTSARLLARLGAPEERAVRDLRADGVPEQVRACLRDYLVDDAMVPAAERVLRVGETVSILGYRVGAEEPVGYRDAPSGVALGAGALPLLIVPAA